MTNTTDASRNGNSENGIERAGSVIVAAVESTWEEIQNRHPQVPDVVVTFGAGTIGSAPGTVRLGHFAAARWATAADAIETPMHELFIGGERLSRGAVCLLGTLLHEAAHALAHARGVKDTSRQGRYHNAKFKTTAEEMGITVAKVGAIGWSETTVPAECVDAYAEEVARLGLAIRAYRRAGAADGDESGDTDDGQAKRRSAATGCPRSAAATSRDASASPGRPGKQAPSAAGSAAKTSTTPTSTRRGIAREVHRCAVDGFAQDVSVTGVPRQLGGRESGPHPPSGTLTPTSRPRPGGSPRTVSSLNHAPASSGRQSRLRATSSSTALSLVGSARAVVRWGAAGPTQPAPSPPLLGIDPEVSTRQSRDHIDACGPADGCNVGGLRSGRSSRRARKGVLSL